MQTKRYSRALWTVVLGVVLVRVAAALLAPIMRDEAYYLEWSKALDWGYFDHPPGVAWLGVTTLLKPSSAFFGRLGGLVATAFLAPLCISLFRRSGLTDERALLAALILVSFNVFGLLSGVILTPDTPFVLAWCLMLHEAAAAIDGQPRRWLTAGLATGFGLLSKYVMVLAFPVLLIGLWFGRRGDLRTRWPWLGLALAFLVFSTHLSWNAANDWTPMRFQLARESLGPHSGSLASSLPSPEPATTTGRVKESAEGGVGELVRHVFGYVGSVLGLWGVLVVVLAQLSFERLRKGGVRVATGIREHLRPLLLAATIVPIAFFGAYSFKMRIEPNWPGVYMVGAAALLGSYAARRMTTTVVAAGLNAALVLVLALHSGRPLIVTPRDRALGETQGFVELAQVVAGLDGPVFFDKHQTGGMLRFFLPEKSIAQWPGFTRPSEFLRRPEWNPWTVEALRQAGSFWVVAKRRPVRQIEGFVPAEVFEVGMCVEQGELVWNRREGENRDPFCAGAGLVHDWIVVQYRPVEGPGEGPVRRAGVEAER